VTPWGENALSETCPPHPVTAMQNYSSETRFKKSNPNLFRHLQHFSHYHSLFAISLENGNKI